MTPPTPIADSAHGRRRVLLNAVISERRRHHRAALEVPRAPTPDEPPAAAPVPRVRRHHPPVRAVLLVGGIGPGARDLTDGLEEDGRVLVVGAAPDAVLGIELVLDLRPDVVLVDRHLGLTSGLVVVRHVHGDLPRAEVVLRTPWPDADAHDARRAGAFVTVDVAASPAVVAASIVAAGERGRARGGARR